MHTSGSPQSLVTRPTGLLTLLSSPSDWKNEELYNDADAYECFDKNFKKSQLN